MTSYLVRRIFQTVIFVILASLLVYTVMVMLMPGGPETAYNQLKGNLEISGPINLPVETLQNGNGQSFDPIKDLERVYKLDKPWPLNFFVWLFDPSDTTKSVSNNQNVLETRVKGIDLTIFGLRLRGSGILTGDFGVSVGYLDNVPISDVIAQRWLNTLLLILCSVVVAIVFGIFIGVISAARPGSQLDHTLTILSLGGLSVPPYVLGVLFILFLGIVPKILHDQNGMTWLPWLPVGDIGDTGFWDRVSHLILPVACLALPQIAWVSRQTRFAMLEVLPQDYIRTAWAKGLGYRRVVYKHALRNSLIPIITHGALIVPAIVSAAAVVETIFAYSGLGRSLFRSLGGCLFADVNRTAEPPPCPAVGYFPIDYPLALVLLLFMVLIVAASSLIADVLYAIADPRINYLGRKG